MRTKILLITLLLSSTIVAFAYEGKANGYEYDIVDATAKTVKIVGGDQKSGNIVIPSTLDGYTVVEIGEEAFDDNDDITSVTIPGTVATLGKKAFYDCDDLTTVIFQENNSLQVIPESFCEECDDLVSLDISKCNALWKICDSAFYDNHMTSLTIPGNVTYIDVDAFDNSTTSDVRTVTFLAGSSETIVNYDDDNFKYATTIILDRLIINDEGGSVFPRATSITIGSHITTIPNNFADGCTDLTTLDLSNANSLTTIGDAAFYRNSLKSLVIPGNVTYIGNDAFDVQGNSNDIKSVTFSAGSSSPIVNYDDANFKSAVSVELNRNIQIGDCSDNNYLFPAAKNITLSNAVTSIPAKFAKGAPLTEITFPETITSIGENAFYDNDKLTSVIIPSSVTSLGEKAFYDCDGLTSMTINSPTITEIPKSFCDGCDKLANLDISKCSALTKICDAAFYDNVFTSITIPNTITYIGNDAFDATGSGQTKLETVTIEGGNAAVLYNYDDANFKYAKTVYVDRDIQTLSSSYAVTFVNAETITIGPDVTAIPQFFADVNTSLTTLNLDNAKNLRKIGQYAFRSCEKLSSLKIPENLVTIGTYAFENCTSVTSLDFSQAAKLDTIASHAFYNVENITLDLTPCTSLRYLGSYVFANGDEKYKFQNEELLIPASVTLMGSRAFDGGMNTLKFLDGSDSLKLNAANLRPENLYLGRTIISTTNLFPKTKNITVGPYVTEIPNEFALAGYGLDAKSSDLETLDLSGSINLQRIGKNAFYSSKLTSVTIPGKVTYIGDDAFDALSDGNNIKTVTFLPGSSETIVSCDDANFKNAETVTLCRNIKNDGSTSYIFPKAKNITIGGNLTTLESYTFHGASSVSAINAQWTNPNDIPALTGSASDYFNSTSPSSIALNVPACTETAYKAKNVWKDFGSITSAGITTYSRDVTGKTWGTVVVPFAIESSDDVQLYNVKSVDLANSTIKLESVDNVAANTPCFFRNIGNVETMSFSGDTYAVPETQTPSVAVSGNYQLIGSYYEQSIAPDATNPNYYLSDGNFWWGENAFSLGANRAYLKAISSPAAKQAFSLVIGDETTGVNKVEDVNGLNGLNGSKYMENGRLVIVKNARKYNAAGQLMK